MLKASEKLDAMNDAFFTRLVPSEDLVLKTPDLAVSLKKVAPNDTQGLKMEEGSTRFRLPGNLGNLGSGNINAKVIRLAPCRYSSAIRCNNRQIQNLVRTIFLLFAIYQLSILHVTFLGYLVSQTKQPNRP